MKKFATKFAISAIIKRALLLLLLVVAVVGLPRSSPEANTFASLTGKFHISYPATWVKVDYNLVDRFLMINKASEGMLNYEAVISDGRFHPFFTGPYFILTVDTLVPMNQYLRDSVLNNMRRTFGKTIKYFPVGDFLTNMESDAPSYDEQQQLITVVSDIKQKQESFKKHILMVKMYDRGVATFYCYTPDSLFEGAMRIFQNVAASFSTENLKEALDRQTGETESIINLPLTKRPEKATSTTGGSSGSSAESQSFWSTSTIVLLTGAIAVLALALFARSRSKKR